MSTQIKAKKEIVLREEDGDAFLYNPDTGRVSVINAAGIIIWKKLSDGSSPDDITAALQKEYQDEALINLNKDRDKFIGELTDLGFVEQI